MSLTLYLHPLSSFCHKALIALYENGTPFTPRVVNLQDEKDRAEFLAIWPVGKFPVLQDEARNELVPESTAIIEYLQQYYPGKVSLIPKDAEAARRVRLLDRNIDLNLHIHMQKIIGDRMRPADKHDAHGVADAQRRMAAMFGLLEKDIGGKTWLAGRDFTLADCAAAPPLFYSDLAIKPLAGEYPNLAAYLDRLKQRPSYARALKEAEPFLQYLPR
jgi:glutathione S-transferase